MFLEPMFEKAVEATRGKAEAHAFLRLRRMGKGGQEAVKKAIEAVKRRSRRGEATASF